MTDAVAEVFPPSPVPTDDEYVGCFQDMVADRVLTTVMTDDAMSIEVTSFHGRRVRPLYISCCLVLASWIGNAYNVVNHSHGGDSRHCLLAGVLHLSRRPFI